ncbi:MAG: hypothetical protein LUG16_00965 [Candidatus Gastranaerophilales bacterium]|nr:hypothetical protein [Candidatus Gastranaerophilales bacterium]
MRRYIILFVLIMVVGLTTGAGYMGTLPDIESEFVHLKKQTSEKASAPYSVEELDKQSESKLKPIPRKNDDYVDIIIKKDKTTNYINDINSVILVLEKLRKCLNTNQDIQKFNAIVSNLIDNIEYIRIEYKDKQESNYLSYGRLIQLSALARETATFRMKSLTTQPYLPYTSSDNIYTKENLDAKLENLLVNVNETIFILKNLE